MSLLKSYILPRLLQWAVVIIVGVTITFTIPRLMPSDPVEQTLQRMSNVTSDPRAVQELKRALQDMYGLEGSTLQQYFAFWRRLLRGDLGPSLGSFPTPVITIIKNALPWTIGLLFTATLISWLIGLFLGTLAGYYHDRTWSKALDMVLITVYPIPYAILALILVMTFQYYVPIFPMVGGATGKPAFTLEYIQSIFMHSFLPALSLIILGTSFRFIMSKALTTTSRTSDYVKYGETAGLPKRKIIFSYVMANTMLPQITDLALSLGAAFEGALITEIIFSYPGIGYQLYTAIMQSDFNLILGVTLFSIIGIATAALVIDLVYPLVDPRVRYR
jgi:peptide/nickel transport system permease protein